MITLVRVVFIFLCMAIGKAQNPVTDIDFTQYQFATTSKFYTNGFSYPRFLDNETHTQSTLGYQLDEKFLIQLNHYYDTYRTNDIQRLELEFKNYLGDKLYLVNGVAMERSISKYEAGNSKPQFMMSTGAGYDVNSNFMIEARYDKNMNKKENQAIGKASLFRVLSKYKF